VVLAAVAVGLCVLVTYAFLGRGVLLSRRLVYAALRAGACTLLVFAIATPETVSETPVRARHALSVLVDGSASLGLPARGEGAESRHDLIVRLLSLRAAELDALRRRYDLRTYVFAREAERAEDGGRKDSPLVRAPAPSGGATALGDALVRALDEAAGSRLAASVVVSDGASNLGLSLDAAASAYARAGVPVHCLSLGDDAAVTDLSVAGVDAPPVASPGKELSVEVRLRARAAAAGKVGVVCRADGREIGRRRVRLPAGDSVRTVSFRLKPGGPGTLVVEVEAEALPGESVRRNNRRLAFVQVEDTELRVIYAEGVLRPDFRAVRRALGAAEGIELDVERAFLRAETGGGGPPRRAFDRVRWEEYDCFVLGELPQGVLPAASARAIRLLVEEHARGLVVLSGPEALGSGPLLDLVPVELLDGTPAPPARLRPTEAGLSHPALRVADRASETRSILSRLGALGDRPTAARARAAAQALLVAEGGVPVLVAGQAGAGRAAVFACGKTHHLADDPDAPEGAYARLLRSLVAWSAGRESSRAILSVRLGRHRLYPGDLVSITARVNRSRAREAGLSDDAVDRLNLVAEVTGPLAEPPSKSRPRQAGGPKEGAHPSPRLRRAPYEASAKEGERRIETVRLERGLDGHSGSVRAGSGGTYRVLVEPETPESRIEPAETLFLVTDEDLEFERLEADPDALRRLSGATGGVFARAQNPDAVFDALLRGSSETVATARRRDAVWDAWWVALLFLCLSFAEWWMRRR
jgi:hypothetical protein